MQRYGSDSDSDGDGDYGGSLFGPPPASFPPDMGLLEEEEEDSSDDTSPSAPDSDSFPLNSDDDDDDDDEDEDDDDDEEYDEDEGDGEEYDEDDSQSFPTSSSDDDDEQDEEGDAVSSMYSSDSGSGSGREDGEDDDDASSLYSSDSDRGNEEGGEDDDDASSLYSSDSDRGNEEAGDGEDAAPSSPHMYPGGSDRGSAGDMGGDYAGTPAEAAAAALLKAQVVPPDWFYEFLAKDAGAQATLAKRGVARGALGPLRVIADMLALCAWDQRAFAAARREGGGEGSPLIRKEDVAAWTTDQLAGPFWDTYEDQRARQQSVSAMNVRLDKLVGDMLPPDGVDGVVHTDAIDLAFASYPACYLLGGGGTGGGGSNHALVVIMPTGEIDLAAVAAGAIDHAMVHASSDAAAAGGGGGACGDCGGIRYGDMLIASRYGMVVQDMMDCDERSSVLRRRLLQSFCSRALWSPLLPLLPLLAPAGGDCVHPVVARAVFVAAHYIMRGGEIPTPRQHPVPARVALSSLLL